MTPPDVRILVPDGHPLAGQSLDLYPASGATSYLEGRVVVTSPMLEQIRELREMVRAALESAPVEPSL